MAHSRTPGRPRERSWPLAGARGQGQVLSMGLAGAIPLLVAAAALTTATAAAPAVRQVDTSNITLSGISSGAAFASQFHVAHSSIVSGVGLLASPPYWCAEDDVLIATSACMDEPDRIVVAELVSAVGLARLADSIDDPKYMSTSRVWIYSGTKDTVVLPGVVQKTVKFYQHYVSSANLKFVDTVPSEHAWITQDFGNTCNQLGSPFINNCALDSAGEIVQFTFGRAMQPPSSRASGSLLQFDQSHYTVVAPFTISMGDVGYIYVPEACAAGACGLHIALHGCLQNLELIGKDFILNNGLNNWADTNRFIVLYPQARVSKEIPYNPKGCWDWWGYTGTAYASKIGPQVVAVKRMVDEVPCVGSTAAVCSEAGLLEEPAGRPQAA